MSLGVLHLISNPDCLVAPVMDLSFIVIAVTAFNLTDLFKGLLPQSQTWNLLFNCDKDMKDN